MAHDRVHLNVGGKHFVTSRTTLANAGRGSMLAAVIDENWQLVPDAASNELFIDRNPAYFTVLLDLLRTGELHVPPGKRTSPFQYGWNWIHVSIRFLHGQRRIVSI